MSISESGQYCDLFTVGKINMRLFWTNAISVDWYRRSYWELNIRPLRSNTKILTFDLTEKVTEVTLFLFFLTLFRTPPFPYGQLPFRCVSEQLQRRGVYHERLSVSPSD